MNKSGFTIIELLIIVSIIGVLASIIAFRYHGAQLRARTAENVKRAHDVINVAEQQIALALSNDERGYPDPKPEGNGEKNDKWKSFVDMVPPGSARHLDGGVATHVPSGSYPERLQYITCRENVDGREVITGVKIAYWDYVEQKVNTVDTGDVSGSGLVCS